MDLKEKLITSYQQAAEQHKNDRLLPLREKAIAYFVENGFPSKKEETWRYTSLRPVLKENYNLFPKDENTLTKEDIAPYLTMGLDSYRMIFVDGHFVDHLSSPVKEDNYTVIPLSKAFEQEREKVDAYFDKVAPKVDRDRFRSLNTAFSREGVFIHVEKSAVVDKPIQILYFSTGKEDAVMLQPRNLIVVEENAQIKVIERHQSLNDNATLTNSVTEITAAEHTIVDYYKIQNDKYTSSLVDNTFIDQHGNESTVLVHTFSLGGKLTRNNLRASQNAEYLNTTFKGVTILEGKQHVDHNTFVHHIQPNNESHQDYKGMFDDRSHGVFDGYILVDKIAQKTDGYQKSDNILMSDRAIAHAKPQLEIYADDVLCSHGCTVGQIGKEALYYLQTRGISKKEAKALMMYAFCTSVLNSVKIPELKVQIDDYISKKLGVKMDFDSALLDEI